METLPIHDSIYTQDPRSPRIFLDVWTTSPFLSESREPPRRTFLDVDSFVPPPSSLLNRPTSIPSFSLIMSFSSYTTSTKSLPFLNSYGRIPPPRPFVGPPLNVPTFPPISIRPRIRILRSLRSTYYSYVCSSWMTHGPGHVFKMYLKTKLGGRVREPRP